MTCLDQIEQASRRRPSALLDSARILFWNAERLKFLEPSIAMLGAAKADAYVLCELDLGMARSGNIHTTADLAQGLDAGYVFAVEFVELGLGDERERGWHKGANEYCRPPRRRIRVAPLLCARACFALKLGPLVRRRIRRAPGGRAHRGHG